MKQHITQERSFELARAVRHLDGAEAVQALCEAAIQQYIDQQSKELPVLPEPIAYIASDKYGNFGIALKENIAMRSCEPGEAVIEPLVLLNLVQAYCDARAAHAREVALSEAMEQCMYVADCYESNGAAILAHDYIRALKKAGK